MTRPDVGVMRELLARVKAVSKPSFDLECAIGRAFESWDPMDGPPSKYTASIDAAAALMERALPGWGWDLVRPAEGAPGKPRATAFKADALWANDGASPALALIAALLTALIAAEDQAHG